MPETLIEAQLRAEQPQANPSPEATERARAVSLAAISNQPARGKSRMRRLTLPLAAAFLILAVSAPAIALRGELINFNESEKAPVAVQAEFSELVSGGAPPEMDPQVVPFSTRKVRDFDLASGRYTLWVAPTKRGGFCAVFTNATGGCVASRAQPVIASVLAASEKSPWLINVSARSRNGAVDQINGFLLTPYPSTLTLEYENGARVDVPVTWVSDPIRAGFFIIDIPAANRSDGNRPLRLEAHDQDGELLAQTERQVHIPPRS